MPTYEKLPETVQAFQLLQTNVFQGTPAWLRVYFPDGPPKKGTFKPTHTGAIVAVRGGTSKIKWGDYIIHDGFDEAAGEANLVVMDQFDFESRYKKVG